MGSIASNQLLIIRADADASIGIGHVMRCLALAQGWLECGGKVIFAGRIISNALQRRIKEAGCSLVDVKQPFPNQDDFELLRKLIQKNVPTTCQWVVIDGYHFAAPYTLGLRQAGAKIMVIDDYAHQPEYSADLLLNQNLGSEGLNYNINSNAGMLLGNKYALLRHEFLQKQNREHEDVVSAEAKHLLVTLGGADPENVTLKVIAALELLKLPQLEIKIIVGPANPHFDLLQESMTNASFSGELVTDIKDMVPLMKWGDVAITAGGSTCLELAFLGVPFAVIILAENQVRSVMALVENKVAVNLGWYNSLATDDIAVRIYNLLMSQKKRTELHENGQQFIDGKGVTRVVDAMRSRSFRRV